MSWIISSVDIPTMKFCKYEKWYYYSDKISELQNEKVLIEGDFYYHEHLFLNRTQSFPDIIDGSYAIAFLYGNLILCASDCISTRNIYYFQNKELFFVSSSLRLILNAVANRAQLLLDSSFLYTYFIYGNKQYLTPYDGIHKLPAGYCIRITDTLHVFPHINFDAELENARRKTDSKDKAEYAVKILKSHCKKIAEKYKNGTVLTEISGGVDSSLLAGLLHEVGKDEGLRMNGYSYTYRNQTIGNEHKQCISVLIEPLIIVKNRVFWSYLIASVEWGEIYVCVLFIV